MGNISDPKGKPSVPNVYMPAESALHLRTLTAFPNLVGAEGDEVHLKQCRKEVASIANAIAEFEPVWLYATASEAAEARSLVNDKVTVKEADIDNLWIRDIGPVFVRGADSHTVDGAIDFNFNYWGGKYEPTADPSFARRALASHFEGITRHQAGVVSEGGALEVDGEGTLMVCDSSIINDNRNPGKSKEEIEEELKKTLGVQKIIWLKGVVGLESTDWHVDAFARFAKPGHIILSQPAPNAHPDILEIYQAALETFKKETDAKGRKFEVTTILEPDHTKLEGNETATGTVAAYANYLIVNGGIIIPRFGESETDDAALEKFRSIFPERRISQVYINALPRLGGGIHCATQQVPA